MSSSQAAPLRFDVYGRFHLEVYRIEGAWQVYRLGAGRKRLDGSVMLPRELTPSEIGKYLEDILHEYAVPGAEIRLLGEGGGSAPSAS